jgi:hypothetical protein
MKDGETPEPSAHIARIACEREERCGSALHQQPVHGLLMGSRERPELIRQSEGEQVVGAGQQAPALRRQPAVGLVAVTLRAVTIPAGVKRVHLRAAVIALMHVASQGGRPTGFEVAQSPVVTGQDAIGEARQIRRPVETDDFRHLEHDALWDRLEVLHQLVQRVGQRRSNFAREMRVDLRRPRTAMAERVLDDPEIHAGFQ